MTIKKQQFQTIRTEGALLPPDILQRISALKVDGASEDAFHLPPGTRIKEAIAQSWSALQSHWKSFQEARQSLGENETGTALTNERWLLPLFKELDYGRLMTSEAPVIDERKYSIERFYNHTPIHLFGCNLPLDRRTKGARGAATASPHSIIQEFLNRSDKHLWAFLSNGLQLRILRDNVSMSRQTYVEFDLESMFEGEVYSDFTLLWLLCHQSRVESAKPEECWLELWSKLAKDQGTRILNQLRIGVANAISALGQGFIGHPRNDLLREKLRKGELTKDDFYRELLRVVYRLLFLFVAEDRELLHPVEADDAAKELYDNYYSTRRLRTLARKIRGSKHADLWHSLSLVFDVLSREQGCEQLALAGLGSFLWRADSTPDLLGPQQSPSPRQVARPVDRPTAAADAATLIAAESPEAYKITTVEHEPSLITNDDLLIAVRSLAFVEQDRVMRMVDYRNLGSEELGSVYESLLELHPVMHIEARSFKLDTAAGNERKTTGSYYTPDSLVQCLLDSALDPVVEERLADAKRMAKGEWRTVTGPSRERFIEYAREQLSRSGSVETRNDHREDDLQLDEAVSTRGTVRANESDASRSRIDSVESGRGVGKAREQGVSAVHQDHSGKSQGTGNATDSQSRSGTSGPSADATNSRRNEDPGEATDSSNAQSTSEEHLASLFSQTPFAVRHSLFAQHAVLGMRVCDPACGSGHFLIAAAHRMARHLARVRTDETEPSPEDYQHALRDVIGRCIYGVDINPMAVELCKVSLWMEAIEPGKPLSFLDHHIQCGNSLLGTTPALLAKGIPDDAYQPIEGDVKAECAHLRKRNAKERKDLERGHGMFAFEPMFKLGNLPATMAKLNLVDDESMADIRTKQELYEQAVRGADYLNARLLADTWCSAFVWKKDESEIGRFCPTEGDFRNIENNPHSLAPYVKAEVQRLAEQFQFFHWHLAFPDVFRLPGDRETAENEQTAWSRGFDVVLGNPPWEKVKVQEKEWFANRVPKIASAPNAAARRRLIAELETTEPSVFANFVTDKRTAEAQSHFLRNSERFPLCGRGDVNTYSVFSELNLRSIALNGMAGFIVPPGILTDDTNKTFAQKVVNEQSLVLFFDFTNRGYIFAGIESTMSFSLLVVSGAQQETFTLTSQVWKVADVNEPGRRLHFTREDVQRINPNTLTLPILRTSVDAELVKYIYLRNPVAVREAEPAHNRWNLKFTAMLHSSGASEQFSTREQLETVGAELDGNVFHTAESTLVPLYESKLTGQYTHRAGTFDESSGEEMFRTRAATRSPSPAELQDSTFVPIPRYWVQRQLVEQHVQSEWAHDWIVGYRRTISAVADSRSVNFFLFPRYGATDSIFLVHSDKPVIEFAATVAGFNSFVFDYVARQKASGGNLSYYVFKQLPVPDREILKPKFEFVCGRVLELTYTAWDLEAFALDCGYSGPPFRWDEERRFLLRCELDAAYFHLYLGSPSEWGRGGREANSEQRMENGEESAGNNHSPLATRRSPSADRSPTSTTNPQLLEMFPTPRDAVAYIMETFPIVKRKDIKRTAVKNDSGEILQPGTYITKDTILQIYDEMKRCIDTDNAYETCLDPRPGPPSDEGGNFIPMQQWNPCDWPSHIHPPRSDDQGVELFRRPGQWGLRGDPLLWRELHERFIAEGFPKNEDELVTRIEVAFEEITGGRLGLDESIFVKRYDAGGMSSGHVDPTWWRATGIPLLRKQFKRK